MSLLDDVKDLPASKWGKVITSKHQRDIFPLARKARQFIFDDAASRKIGHFVATCPDLIVDNLEFAEPPYDPFYLEFNIKDAIAASGRHGTAEGDIADWRLGLLFDHGTVYSIANSHAHPTAQVSPFGWLDARQVQIDGRIKDNAQAHSQLLLGSSWHDLDPARRAIFGNAFDMTYLGAPDRLQDFAATFSTAMAGEVRFYVAALLMLYQRQHIHVSDRPPERRIARGKLRTFMAHSVVTIHLSDEIEMRRVFATGDRGAPRRHEVRTHYAHRYGTRHCEHDWVRIEDADNEQWRCKRCDRLRYLKRSFLRGDAAKGFVTKEYRVTI